MSVHEGSWTIDGLAAATGVPSRTIRLYQTEGILPKPDRRGRVGRYDQQHAERLQLIADLRARGLRLSAIRELLRRPGAADTSVGQWLGLSDALTRPWTEDAPVTLTDDELAALVDGRPPGIRGALVRAGLVVPAGGGSFGVPSPVLLEVALRLEAAGIAVEVAAGAAEILRKRLRRAADEVVGYFSAEIHRQLGWRASPADVQAALDALRPAGLDAVRAIYAQEVDRAVSKAVVSTRPVRARGARSAR